MLTGNSDEQMGSAAIQAGAQDYAVKGQYQRRAPVARILRYALERHQAEERLRRSQERLLLCIMEGTNALGYSVERAYRYTGQVQLQRVLG